MMKQDTDWVLLMVVVMEDMMGHSFISITVIKMLVKHGQKD
uniref:Uncharacterized protein n=1 Tax=viral metagenome TaxID=1070528 RepID=A0A6C0CIB8_9ZZZZ